MTRILYFLLIFNSINFLNAKTNAIYFELLGSGLTYSINYEKTISDHISLRTGLGSFTLKDKENVENVKVFKVEKHVLGKMDIYMDVNKVRLNKKQIKPEMYNILKNMFILQKKKNI